MIISSLTEKMFIRYLFLVILISDMHSDQYFQRIELMLFAHSAVLNKDCSDFCYTPTQWSVIGLIPIDHACFCSVTLAYIVLYCQYRNVS